MQKHIFAEPDQTTSHLLDKKMIVGVVPAEGRWRVFKCLI